MPVCAECMNRGECDRSCYRTEKQKRADALKKAREAAKMWPKEWGAYLAGAEYVAGLTVRT